MRLRYHLLLCFFGLSLQGAGARAQTWHPVTPFPGGVRDAAVSFSFGDTLYMGGGEGYRDFYTYQPKSGVWTKLPNLPTLGKTRDFASFCTLGGRAYLAFGWSSNAGQSTVTKDFWTFDPSART